MSNLVQHPRVSWIQCADAGPDAAQRFACVCRACGAQMPAYGDARGADAFAQTHAAHQGASKTHLGLGDVVAKMTSAVGIKPCTPCEARRRAMNGMFPQVMRRR